MVRWVFQALETLGDRGHRIERADLVNEGDLAVQRVIADVGKERIRGLLDLGFPHGREHGIPVIDDCVGSGCSSHFGGILRSEFD